MKRLIIFDQYRGIETWMDVPDKIFDALRDLAAQPILDHGELLIRRGPEGSFQLERKELR